MESATPSDEPLRSRLERLFKTQRVEFGENLVQTPLLDHQTLAVAFHYLAKRSLINYPVGAGKTLIAIAAAMLMRQRDGISRILVICQPTQMGYWAGQFHKETFIKPHVIYGSKESRKKKIAKIPRYVVTICAYPTFLRDIGEYCKMGYDLVITDEGTVIKNREAQISHAVKAVCKRSKSVMLLTATPLQNHPGELFSLMEAVDENVLGDYHDFVDRYCVEETMLIRRRGRIFRVTKITGIKQENIPELIDKLSLNILTRNREELSEMNLPPIIYQDRWLEFTPAQAQKYHEVENGVLSAGDTMKYVELLARFVYQLQICDSVKLVDPGMEDRSPKIDELMTLLAGEYSGEKVIIFSMFKRTVKLIQQALEEKGIPYLKITGDEKILGREAIRQKFADDPDVKVMIITTAAEMGANLQAAGVMVIVSRLFNPQRMKQIVGRVYRQGQKRSSVVIINLLMRNTIETRVLAILKKKAELYDAIFGKGKDMEFKHDALRRIITGQVIGEQDPTIDSFGEEVASE